MVPPNQGRITRHGLFADIRGEPGSPPLLFLHGGPGQGCHDFMALQGDRLAGAARVIGIDQRGVDRSAPLPDGAGVTIADLVADCEDVRRALGIERWAVLGHSFGGGLALRYAAAHPDAVTAVLFENPVWDLAMSCRSALPAVAALLDCRGRVEARAARAAAGREDSARALRAAYVAALAGLGEAREEFFVPDPGTRALLARVRLTRQREPADGEAAGEAGSERHHQAISADDASYESLLPLLPTLAAPALLITGGRDPITSPGQRAAFRAASAANRVLEFPEAAHFVHADDPDGYAAAVTRFLVSEPVRSTGW